MTGDDLLPLWDIVASCSTIAALFCLLIASLLRPCDRRLTPVLSSGPCLTLFEHEWVQLACGMALIASGRVTFTRPPTRLSISSRGFVRPPLTTM